MLLKIIDAISSAASLVILLLLRYSFVSVQLSRKAFAIFIAPSACRSLLQKYNSCKYTLQEITTAMSSAA